MVVCLLLCFVVFVNVNLHWCCAFVVSSVGVVRRFVDRVFLFIRVFRWIWRSGICFVVSMVVSALLYMHFCNLEVFSCLFFSRMMLSRGMVGW